MTDKTRILFLSANPPPTSRILVDVEGREIFEKLQEGPYRDRFDLLNHTAIRPVDLQRLLMTYEPEIVHFSGHGSKTHKIILGGTRGRGKEVDPEGFVECLSLYKNHVKMVFLNACFTKEQARSLSEAIDYSIGAGGGIGDRGGVAFAAAFYRALGFGKSIRRAFESAQAELALVKMPRTKGIELFVRDGIKGNDQVAEFNASLESLKGKQWSPLIKDLGTALDDCKTPNRLTVVSEELILVHHRATEYKTALYETHSVRRIKKWTRSEVGNCEVWLDPTAKSRKQNLTRSMSLNSSKPKTERASGKEKPATRQSRSKGKSRMKKAEMSVKRGKSSRG